MARLEMSPTASKINITCFRSVNDKIFKLVYFGDSIEFRLEHLTEEVCEQIIETCHQIMSITKCKYNFAVMCSSDESDRNACGLGRKRHLLPIRESCLQCSKTLSTDHDYWNNVILEV